MSAMSARPRSPVRGVTVKNGRYYRVVRTGPSKQRWIPLSRVSEGEAALYEALKRLTETPAPGDFRAAIKHFLNHKLPELAPGTRAEYQRNYEVISTAFCDFRVDEVRARDVRDFLAQWADAPTMRHHLKARLSTFFSWAVIDGLCDLNPCREVKLPSPPKRETQFSDAAYHAIRDRLSPMLQCLMDLCYLTAQRVTDIRLLRWDQVTEDGIRFQPSKTLRSSGVRVTVPLTPPIRAVLECSRTLGRIKGLHVLHTGSGAAYTKTGLISAWVRARKAVGLSGLTWKDLRAKALTDAERGGHALEELRKTAAHTTVTTTEGYLRQYREVLSTVELTLPDRLDV